MLPSWQLQKETFYNFGLFENIYYSSDKDQVHDSQIQQKKIKAIGHLSLLKTWSDSHNYNKLLEVPKLPLQTFELNLYNKMLIQVS